MLSCRRQSTARLLEAGKLSLVLDLDHTLLASSRSARVLLSSPSPAHSFSFEASSRASMLSCNLLTLPQHALREIA